MPAKEEIIHVIDGYIDKSRGDNSISVDDFLEINNEWEYKPILNLISAIRNESVHCKLEDTQAKQMFQTIRLKWLNNTFESSSNADYPTAITVLAIDSDYTLNERRTTMAKPVHTVKHDNGWANRQNGRIVSEHRTQSNAIDKAITIAKKGNTEHVIHGLDGKIRDKNSYGNDPYPPKG